MRLLRGTLQIGWMFGSDRIPEVERSCEDGTWTGRTRRTRDDCVTLPWLEARPRVKTKGPCRVRARGASALKYGDRDSKQNGS